MAGLILMCLLLYIYITELVKWVKHCEEQLFQLEIACFLEAHEQNILIDHMHAPQDSHKKLFFSFLFIQNFMMML